MNKKWEDQYLSLISDYQHYLKIKDSGRARAIHGVMDQMVSLIAGPVEQLTTSGDPLDPELIEKVLLS